jgi:hypothetical protein
VLCTDGNRAWVGYSRVRDPGDVCLGDGGDRNSYAECQCGKVLARGSRGYGQSCHSLRTANHERKKTWSSTVHRQDQRRKLVMYARNHRRGYRPKNEFRLKIERFPHAGPCPCPPHKHPIKIRINHSKRLTSQKRRPSHRLRHHDVHPPVHFHSHAQSLRPGHHHRRQVLNLQKAIQIQSRSIAVYHQLPDTDGKAHPQNRIVFCDYGRG